MYYVVTWLMSWCVFDAARLLRTMIKNQWNFAEQHGLIYTHPENGAQYVECDVEDTTTDTNERSSLLTLSAQAGFED